MLPAWPGTKGLPRSVGDTARLTVTSAVITGVPEFRPFPKPVSAEVGATVPSSMKLVTRAAAGEAARAQPSDPASMSRSVMPSCCPPR